MTGWRGWLLLPALAAGAGAGRAVQSSHPDSCPLLDGVFLSVLRRVFGPGYHKELVSEVGRTALYNCTALCSARLS